MGARKMGSERAGSKRGSCSLRGGDAGVSAVAAALWQHRAARQPRAVGGDRAVPPPLRRRARRSVVHRRRRHGPALSISLVYPRSNCPLMYEVLWIGAMLVSHRYSSEKIIIDQEEEQKARTPSLELIASWLCYQKTTATCHKSRCVASCSLRRRPWPSSP